MLSDPSLAAMGRTEPAIHQLAQTTIQRGLRPGDGSGMFDTMAALWPVIESAKD